MKLLSLHPWDVSLQEAKELQVRLAPLVSCSDAVPLEVRYLAGVDISPPDTRGLVRAAVVVSYPELEPVEVSLAEPLLPYIPGLLSFRETPVLVKALDGLRTSPDVIIVGGQGYAHPRRFGLACHIGLITDTPTIGCAKSILVGEHGELGEERGSETPLEHQGETIGTALRTRDRVRPVYVSVGHKVDLSVAARWVLACCRGRRLPETTRLAHLAAAGRRPRTDHDWGVQRGKAPLPGV